MQNHTSILCPITRPEYTLLGILAGRERAHLQLQPLCQLPQYRVPFREIECAVLYSEFRSAPTRRRRTSRPWVSDRNFNAHLVLGHSRKPLIDVVIENVSRAETERGPRARARASALPLHLSDRSAKLANIKILPDASARAGGRGARGGFLPAPPHRRTRGFPTLPHTASPSNNFFTLFPRELPVSPLPALYCFDPRTRFLATSQAKSFARPPSPSCRIPTRKASYNSRDFCSANSTDTATAVRVRSQFRT